MIGVIIFGAIGLGFFLFLIFALCRVSANADRRLGYDEPSPLADEIDSWRQATERLRQKGIL